MTSALSERGSWAQLPQGTKDAVMHVLASPTLLNLTLDSISCLPVTFFSIDMKIKYLALRRITFPRFKPETTSAAFSNYSKMNTDTLEILLHHWFEPRFQTIIEMPNSFISRIRHLIIHNFGPTILFADPIMTSALNSLETLQIREERTQSWKHVPSTRWFQRDLATIPRLKNLEFHFMFGFCTDAEFYQSTTASLRKIINLLKVNPTAAQIQRFSIRFVRCWTELSVRRWFTASDALAIPGHCGEIDQILDAGRDRVSSSSGCTVGIDLGLTPRDSRRYLYGGPDDAEWHELMNRMLDAWRGKIHAMMPLASQRRALVFNDIFETRVFCSFYGGTTNDRSH
ncbi:hypothetical protein Hypma_004278 [Hypsizygus marmoreus]|uniref:F-box domain-containing protein n=1 Tax=Hypsizygus marmoreus TaxID=39966 RepID=A0A369J0E5_HYPMA|nr:hypothetical protein Hypma_004278 [Hypsizygus marmoreus]